MGGIDVHLLRGMVTMLSTMMRRRLARASGLSLASAAVVRLSAR
jgi:hypothetical protein